MFKFENFVEAKDTSNKILDGIGIKEEIEDYPILSDIFRNNSIISFERPGYFSSVDELKKIYRVKINEENEVIAKYFSEKSPGLLIPVLSDP